MFVFLQGEKGEDGIPGENGGMVIKKTVVNFSDAFLYSLETD